MAEYSFRLVWVTVTIQEHPVDGRFEATVRDVDGAALATGDDSTEAGAVGLAVLKAKNTWRTCDGCGDTLRRDDLVQDAGRHWYCPACSWDKMIPAQKE